jgi:hypothetical protein
MKLIGHFEDQREAPQHDDGIEHDARGRVLVAVELKTAPVGFDARLYEDLKLVWRLGGKHWSARGERSYGSAELQALGGRQDDNPKYRDVMPRTIFAGGRIGKDRVKAALPEIRKAMKGLPIRMEHIDTKKTFVVTGIE